MKKMMKKTVGILLVASCMIGTTGFADSYFPPNENEVPQECVIMQPTSAIDMLGGIPENITGPDREDLEVLLADIDKFNESGNFEKADMIWTYVFDILSNYELQDPDGFEPDPHDPDVFEPGTEAEPQDFHIEEIIGELEGQIEHFESIGDFEMAESLRGELERLLEMGIGYPDVNHENHEDPKFVDVEQVIAEMEEEIRFLMEADDFEAANHLRGELEDFMNNLVGEGIADHGEYEMEPDILTVEDILNKIGYDLSPEKVNEIERLVNEINAIVGEAI